MADRLPIEISGTFDIEAHAWNRFALGVCYDGAIARHWWGTEAELNEDLPEDVPPFVVDPTAERSGEAGGLDGMIDHMRARGGVWFGHGAGIYDSLAILERARARGIRCSVDRSSHRVTRVVMGPLELRDSYGLWPVPLDEISGSLRRKVPHLPWACTCGRRTCACGCGGCGGFCRIGERAAAGDPDLLDYCTADCRDLYDGLHGLRDFTTANRIDLRGTLGQTAWRAARDELGVPESDLPWHLWRQIRKADKGGRQCVVRPRAAGPGAHYDICNAYPAQLAKIALPVGSIRELGKPGQARGALSRERPGIYTATISVPDLFVPPLPWSMAGRMYFPVGEVTGTWVLPEILAALERGCRIVSVESATIWEATAPIFEELIARWYEVRRGVGRKSPHGQWVGRLAKALTGKLSEKPERQRVLVHPESMRVCLRRGPCRGGCSGRCGAYEQLDLRGEIFGVPYQKLGGSAYPQWSAYLRAATRVQWMREAEAFGDELCFGNTDSLWVTGRRKPAPLGDGLGEWEYQHAWSDLDVRTATVYAFRPSTGCEQPVTVRGIPWATEEDWKRGGGMLDRGVLSFGQAVKSTQGLWTQRSRKWTLPRGHDDGRAIWCDRKMSAAGYTVPLHADEIREQILLERQRMTKWQRDAVRARAPRRC